ncbi:hypothetical protein BU23DRAFT_567641 [Bimuria novae-zelandiae CBS 107.79]|uniref:Uncharacterized protein n=1 Tax=Bimuria novae-zelandiae CBS 107.79 TaxID=1447943 RepID=A0A6A5VAB6_9PLEO|nr:hypothetical protein BU23DRAFT_567641 [Bimuria novae-zelandiae CBS 107.79]
MAFSCTNTSLVAARPFIPYVVPTSKSKRKPNTKAGTVQRNLVEVNIAERIDDSPAPCSDTCLPPLDTRASTLLVAADASGLQSCHTVRPLTSTSREHLRNTCVDVVGDLDNSSAWKGLEGFSGNSQEFPFNADGPAEEGESTAQVEPSREAYDYQVDDDDAAAGAEAWCAEQGGEVDGVRTDALSEQEIGCVPRVGSMAEDQPLVDASSGSPSGRKRARSSQTGTIFTSAETPDIPSLAGLDDADKRKRQRTFRNTGNPILDLTPVPEPMPSPVTSSGPPSRCRASNERSPFPLDSGSLFNGVGTPFSPLQNLEEGSDAGVDELLRSPRRDDTFTGRQGDEAIYPGSVTPAAYGTDKGSGDEAEEGHSGERSHIDRYDGSLRETSQWSNHRGRPIRMNCRGQSRPSLGSSRRTRMPASALPSIASSRITQPSMPRTESAFQTCSPQRQSPKSKAGGSHNQMGAKMAYEITDLTHIQVPKGSSVVTMIVRCIESNLPLHPITSHHGLFGSEGKVIRMTQLSPDSWMLVGYQSDDVAPSACSRENPTLLNIRRASISTSDSASDGDGSSDEDEACEEDHVARTRTPWLKSDEERLLSLRDKMLMS